MKIFKFAFPLFLALFILSSNTINAQIIDSLPWFKLDNQTLNRIFVFEGMDFNSTYIIPDKSKKNILALPKASLQKLGVTRVQKNAKSINTPLILKKDGNCYEINCKRNGCDGTLIWVDQNKDNKVQPKKELRCVCLETKEACKIVGRKIPCVTRN